MAELQPEREEDQVVGVARVAAGERLDPVKPTFAGGPGGRPLGPAPGSRVVVSCVSRHVFTIRVRRLAGARLRSLKVLVGKRNARVVRRSSGAFVVKVDLRGRAKGSVKVTLRGRTTRGRVVSGERRYKTCARRNS